MAFRKSVSMLLWQLAVSSEMIGLETCTALISMMMIADIQTLGAPISIVSIPGTISSCTSIFLIPTLGVVTDRWSKTRRSKAMTMCLTSSIQLIGLTLVFVANVYELLKEGSLLSEISGSSNSTFDDYTIYRNTSIVRSNTTAPQDWESLATGSRYSSKLSPSTPTLRSTPLHSKEASHSACEILIEKILEGVPWNAYLAIVGFALLDSGYDTTACFLKVFVLNVTPPDYHASVLIKLVLAAGVGGVLITGIGSSNIDLALTADTGLDPNALMCCIITIFSITLLVVGTSCTVLTGLLWKPPKVDSPDGESEELSDTVYEVTEKTNLETDRSSNYTTDTHKEDQINQIKASDKLDIEMNRVIEQNTALPLSVVLTEYHSKCVIEVSQEAQEKELRSFCQRHKKLILINILSFLLMSAFVVFNDYSVNFLGQAVFNGDPSAPKDSQEYLAYLHGVTVGSRGILISYVTCTFVNLFHEDVLYRLGWKLDALVVTLVHCIFCLALSETLNVWVFYFSAVWFGVYRAIALSVPYILANTACIEQGGKNSSVFITSVSTMMPVSVLVCSPLIGPIIEATGNAKTNVYYSCVCAFLACVAMIFVKF